MGDPGYSVHPSGFLGPSCVLTNVSNPRAQVGVRYRLHAGRVRCLDVEEGAALPAAVAESHPPYDTFQEDR